LRARAIAEVTAQDTCCNGAPWVRVADLGHAGGIDCALVRCSACGRSWAHLWTPHAPGERYSPVEEAVARDLLQLAVGPERKRRLRELLDL